MIVVSNDFKNELRQPKTIDAKIVIGSSTITSNELNSIQRVFKTSLFKSVMKQVNVDSNTTIAKDSFINPQFGLYIGNAFEYVSLGSFKVNDEPILNKDTNSYEITSYDKIVESMIPYALDENDITYPCTVRQLFVAIFTKLGWAITGIPATFVNSTSNIEEDVFSNVNMTYRDVLDELCTISCMFLVDKENPTLLQKTTTSEIINEYNTKNTNVAIKNRVFFNSLVFSRAEESDNIYRKDDTSITNNGLHEFKVSDLQILSMNWRDNFIDAMWNYIKTFEYYSYDVDTYGIAYLEPIDQFTLSIFNDTYTTLLLCSDLTISNGVKEKIYADEPVESETEYKYADTTDKKINQTNLIVDKQNQIIQGLVSSTQIISNEMTSNNSIQLSNSYEGSLHYLSIKGQMSLLYPSNTLYPNNNLYSLDSYLLVDTSKVKLDINYLNYISDEVCDEFIYEDGKCKIIRRVGVNNDNTLYQLQQEYEEQRQDTIINVKSNSIIKMESFDNLLYKVQYLLQNDYTNVFSPSIDLISQINLTPGNVLIEASKLATIEADKIDLSGKEIDLTGDNITIKSNNFKVDENGNMIANNGTFNGILNSNEGKVGGWEIGDTYLRCEIKPAYDYTSSDVQRIQSIITGDITPTSEDYKKYDFNSDNIINSYDLLVCQKLVIYNLKNSVPGYLIFDTSDWFKPIKIINSDGEILASFGVNGVYTKPIE